MNSLGFVMIYVNFGLNEFLAKLSMFGDRQ